MNKDNLKSVICLCIFLLTGSCAAQNPDNGTAALSEHVKQYSIMKDGDLEYISKNTKHKVPYELNMGNDAQYRYTLHNLREGGDSPEKSPALYRHLKSLRDSAIKANKSDAAPMVCAAFVNRNSLANARSSGSSDSLQSINLLTGLYSTDGINYTTSGYSSIYNGCNCTTMRFTMVTKETHKPFYISPLFKVFGINTENFSQSVTAKLPAHQRGENVISHINITPSEGNPIHMSSEDCLNATDQCVTSPNYGLHQDPSVIPCPSPGATCVNKGDVSTPIVSCYGRTDANSGMCGPCNYGYPKPGHPDSLALMISGSITFPDTIIANALGNPQGQVIMYLQQSNGGCILKSQYTDGGPLPSNFTIDNSNPKVLNYCFSGGDFTSATCFKDLVNSTVDLNLTVYVLIKVSSSSNYAQAKVSSVFCDSIKHNWCAQIPEICIVQGCLAKGTLITLADGTTKKVEDFLGGESVKSSGANRTVGSTSSGHEWIPIYRIKTKNGKMVRISSKHAVPTNSGIKLVRNLAVGDVVTTDQGPSKISEISREKYEGTVHNFMVGNPGEAEKGNANMYANGILVGDLASQQYYTRSFKAKKFTLEELKAQVDKEWYVDLENYFKTK